MNAAQWVPVEWIKINKLLNVVFSWRKKEEKEEILNTHSSRFPSISTRHGLLEALTTEGLINFPLLADKPLPFGLMRGEEVSCQLVMKVLLDSQNTTSEDEQLGQRSCFSFTYFPKESLSV